jgi:hypothetical protein
MQARSASWSTISLATAVVCCVLGLLFGIARRFPADINWCLLIAVLTPVIFICISLCAGIMWLKLAKRSISLR